MRQIQSSEVKARLPQFLDDVERGETIIITRHGRPVAHLVPAPVRDREVCAAQWMGSRLCARPPAGSPG